MVPPPKPVVVTISHELGRDEARRRLDDGLNQIRRLVTPFTSSLEYRWAGYRLEFGAVAMWQSISGHIDIEDRLLRIELGLPRLLQLLARTISRRISAEGTRLLAKPDG
jgi:Putative polyhydroxyalkanoic acid system protein (PHA_gran_rgn)